MSPATRRRLRVLGGVLILALLVWRVGTAAVLDGLRAVDARSLAARHRHRGAHHGLLGLALAAGGPGPGRRAGPRPWPWLAATARSSSTRCCPAGVLGDVHRGVQAGRDAGDTARGLRAVFWERTAGQVVQLAMAIVVLVALPSPVRSSLPALALAAVAVVVVLALLDRFAPRARTAWWARLLHAGRSDLRHGVLARGVWPGVLLASTVAVAGYVALFLLAARTAGVDAPTALLLPLGHAGTGGDGASPPTSPVGDPAKGWRSGRSRRRASVQRPDSTTAVVFGVLTFVACLPGAVVLLVLWARRHPRRRHARRAGADASRAGGGGADHD